MVELKVAKKKVTKAPAVKKTAKVSVEKEETVKKVTKATASTRSSVESKKVADTKYVPAMGKRKTASASIRMHANGSGIITINGQTINDYFTTDYQKKVIDQPLKHTGMKDMDFSILVKGGGKTAQADACRLGIAKLLIKLDPELHPTMRAKGWVTRDSRKKERKKPGLKRARRAPQWSKR
jgi:small subunit ribosomal protein S9